MAESRIRTQFITLFMVIGLIPIVVVSALFFIQTRRILIDEARSELSAIQNIRVRQIQTGINRRVTEFETLISSNSFDDIIAHVESGGNSELYSGHFSSIIDNNGFGNIFVVNDKSKIIYEDKRRPELLNNNSFKSAYRRALYTNNIVIEDFSSDELISNHQSAFFAGKVYYNNRIYVVIGELLSGVIEDIMDSTLGMGETGESYLIFHNIANDKYEFRSNQTSMGNGKYIIGYKWTRDALDYWIDAIPAGYAGDIGSYRDSENNRVLVAYNKLDLPEFNWYLVSRIRLSEVLDDLDDILLYLVLIVLSIIAFLIFLSFKFSDRLTRPIIEGASFARGITRGEYNRKLDIVRKDEIGTLVKALREMGKNLHDESWLRSGKEGLDDALRGEHDIDELGRKIVSFMVKHLDAQTGALYLRENDTLNLSSSYAFSDTKGLFNKFKIGEGMIGQSALDKEDIIYTDVPNSPEFNFGASSIIPTSYISSPLVFEDEVVGVLLVGITVPATKLQKRFISEVKDSLAIILNSAKAGSLIQGLLEEAQIKQEELRVTNEELEQQTYALKTSEKELQSQQEELRVINEELEERTEALEKNRSDIEKKNRELEILSSDLEKKAEDLQLASKYKSEFLANMSHELRTPLNSILILSKLLWENKKGNLYDKQIESAGAINASGEDLLKLINEILDLSKVEAGKVEINKDYMKIDDLINDLLRIYRPTAESKNIAFNYSISEDVPESLLTDSHRLQQVLRNLLTNGFKFTDEDGSVHLKIYKDREFILFEVTDTGIGIPEDKLETVFEAFQQADGSTSRKYGGTGLGLSISRELTKLLGGNLSVTSKVGEGSSFTISLPLNQSEPVNDLKVEVKDKNDVPVRKYVEDDRHGYNLSRKTLLIIEDDINFASILKDQAHEKGFDVLIAEDGETGLHFADYYRPSGIVLDIGLPGIDGWTVLERLKKDSELKNIPVHLMTGSENEDGAINSGAIGYLMKPVTLESIQQSLEKIERNITEAINHILIVEDDELQRESISELMSDSDVEVTGVTSGKEALETLSSSHFDCIILDLSLGDISGYELLQKIKQDDINSDTPVIIYTGEELSAEEEMELNRFSESIIIKGIKSPERLLEETSLFLHHVDKAHPQRRREEEPVNHKREEVLAGKKLLIVDDDMRNIFALSNILEEKDIEVVVARDGVESIEKVNEHRDIDLILMDIMMPRMDGYEAMGEIRKIKSRDELPIIALTANAMKGDRHKCISAGANDYLAKPVDTVKLLSMLRVWLYK